MNKVYRLLKPKGLFITQQVGGLNNNEFVVYYARIIEWEFPNFSVESCFNQLCKLQLVVEKKGFVESKQHRFVIVAQKLTP